MKSSLILAVFALGGMLLAQEANPTQKATQEQNGQEQTEPSSQQKNPIFRVQVVSRTIQAVSYRNRSGWTKVDFQGTALAPKANGQAQVNSRKGYIQVKATVKRLPPAMTFGNEYLTYVLWAITPDGRPKNLGELLVNGDGNADIDVTTDLQSFGLIVTAEPYFAVTQPSDVVVMENIIRKDTKGKFEEVDAKYQLLPRGIYTAQLPSGREEPMQMDKKVPLELYEARNAVLLSRAAGADKYATEVFQNAQNLLNQAQQYQDRKAGERPVIMTSREAVQKSEDARIISIRRQRELAIQMQREEQAARVSAAKAAAAESARQQQLADQQRQLAEQQAQLDAQKREQAERARKIAEAAQAQAAAEAERARQSASQADAQREAMRKQMLAQLNQVLQTRETARGLIMNLSDVLFDFGKYTLKPDTREKLAKVSGILLAHPDMKLQVEGYTDNVGSDEFNQKLSEQRADAVRDYLISQGISADSVTAKGFGKTNPIASNDSAKGRQQNRRVEIVVSGGAIGGNPEAPEGQPGATPAPPNGQAPAAPPAPANPGAPPPPPPQ
ncbi:MAG TPA: OmpA family protein [Bryobacteraceae bacterium]|jgi:outer membrane protein OmpA-like peptidoglycan-associated protein|nr:OmpA family protein [Bryobacteraceae bacterium]